MPITGSREIERAALAMVYELFGGHLDQSRVHHNFFDQNTHEFLLQDDLFRDDGHKAQPAIRSVAIRVWPLLACND